MISLGKFRVSRKQPRRPLEFIARALALLFFCLHFVFVCGEKRALGGSEGALVVVCLLTNAPKEEQPYEREQ